MSAAPKQPELPLVARVAANDGERTRPLTLDERFKAFVEQNPHVIDTLTRLAREARARGMTKVGVKMLWEIARWEAITSTTGDEWKLNNSFHSRAARLVMEREPDLAGFFETRELKS